MSLSAWLVDAELLGKHFEACDVPLCDTCITCLERWAIEYARDYEAKKENGAMSEKTGGTVMCAICGIFTDLDSDDTRAELLQQQRQHSAILSGQLDAIRLRPVKNADEVEAMLQKEANQDAERIALEEESDREYDHSDFNADDLKAGDPSRA